ncbi:MAG: HDOD domain-containing protein [Solirubrobacteraceae bacterium]|jgi:putative nucleotidyltransferase with HDIG domain
MSANETAAARQLATQSPAQPLEERQGEGHGRRLTAAFDALEGFPALAEARNRLLALVGNHRVPLADVVETVESDIALVVAVLRLANDAPVRGGARVENIPDAVRILTPEAVHQLAERMRTFDYFERSAIWEGAPDRFRLHALATRAAAELLATEIGYPDRDRLIVAALLHDIGKLVLMHAYSGYPSAVHRDARTPEERVQRERRELGVDHAVVGGVLARRWGLPKSLANAIERHHSDEPDGDAALVRLADMLAHYTHDDPVSPADMLRVARSAGVGSNELRAVLYELPQSSGSGRRRVVEACPLSARERDVLRLLAEGKVYKQIAQDLTLSTSTVRTHLHNVYGKLGAVDRAQAVLIATERGWL